MRNRWFQLFLVIAAALSSLLSGCTGYPEPEDATDAGRQFVEALYNGNFKRARLLLVTDNEAQQKALQAIEKDFRSRNSADKEALSKSPMVIKSINNGENGAAVIQFQNAYTQQPASIYCVSAAGLWRVDLEQSKFYSKP